MPSYEDINNNCKELVSASFNQFAYDTIAHSQLPLRLCSDVSVMGDDNKGYLLVLIHTRKKPDDLLLGILIEVARGLVCQDYLRPVYEGPRNGYSPLLAA